jgi:cation:H+ antiporter
MSIVYLLVGLALLVVGAEFLVRGGGNLALAMRVPALIVGLTIVAAGTSAPEFVVSVMASIDGNSAIAMANVVGSNIVNITFILGASALVRPLVVDRAMLRRDVPSAIFMQILVASLAWDLTFSRVDGALVLLSGLAYNAWLFRDVLRGRSAPPDDELEVKEAPLWQHALMVVVGLVVLVLGADLFVDGALDVARTLGLSERFIGLTIVAIGTSMPELATSLLAAWKAEGDIAAGNVVGSNIFNIWMVLGIASLVRPMELTAGFQVDNVVAVAVTILLVPIILQGTIGRLGGGLLMAGYVAYVAWSYSAGA